MTDLARYKNDTNLGDAIIKWMSNKSSFDFYCLWEELFNDNFKLAVFREFKNDAASQSFTMSPSRWISLTNSKGFVSKRGKYNGGTFAHSDMLDSKEMRGFNFSAEDKIIRWLVHGDTTYDVAASDDAEIIDCKVLQFRTEYLEEKRSDK